MKSKKTKVLWIKHTPLTDHAKKQIKTFLEEKVSDTGRKMKLNKIKELDEQEISRANIIMIDDGAFIDILHKLDFQRKMLERCVGIDTELYFYRCDPDAEGKRDLYSIKKVEVDVNIFEVFNEDIMKKERV